MNQFLVFVRKEWLHILRDKRTLFILFGMPVAQILIFGFALSNEVKNSNIAILDRSCDATSHLLIERLEASKYFDISSILNSEQEIHSAFKKGNIRMIVYFPQEFGHALRHQNDARVQFIVDASDPNVGNTLVAYASSIFRDYQNELLVNNKLPYQIDTEVRMMYNPQLQSAYQFVPGVMAMVLLLICSLMTSVAIVREKEMGTMEVLLVSPIKPLWVVTAKTIPYLSLSFINICSILLLSYFVLHVPIRGSLFLLLSMGVLFSVTSLSLGMFVSTIAQTQTAAMFGTLIGLFMPTLMLSGFMFPIDNMPIPLQLVSNLVPSKWFFYLVNSIMIKGLGLKAVWKESVILTGMTVFMLFLSIRKFDQHLQV